eukprot:scaffold808_cov196-Alexandrium_tamarense.AAC.74
MAPFLPREYFLLIGFFQDEEGRGVARRSSRLTVTVEERLRLGEDGKRCAALTDTVGVCIEMVNF